MRYHELLLPPERCIVPPPLMEGLPSSLLLLGSFADALRDAAARPVLAGQPSPVLVESVLRAVAAGVLVQGTSSDLAATVWLDLAGRSEVDDPLVPRSFARFLGARSVEQAIGLAGEGRARVVLARWFVVLTSGPTVVDETCATGPSKLHHG